MSQESATSPRRRFPLETLCLNETLDTPLYRQLEDQLREAILEGRLKPNARLPSTRQLAADLKIARNTAINAYNQLIIEGYLVTASGSGTRVALDLPEQLLQVPGGSALSERTAAGRLPGRRKPEAPAIRLSSLARKMSGFTQWIENDPDRPSVPFRPHSPASDSFPRDLWAQITMRHLRQASRGLLERGDPRGYAPLREVVADYLGSARAVACAPSEIFISAGTQQAIELIAKLLIEPGDTVCMEDPGYTPARLLFELAGASVVAIPVDEDGLDVAELERTVTSAKLVYVTPGSQFPLGMTLPLARRLALIDWAERAGAIILEDDYNGEYRYAGRPLPALYGLAPRGRVLYAGSFSKLLFPSLRMGYLVLPDRLVENFAAARWLVDRHSPPLEQAVLADFIDQGHFARHVRRMRTLYAERQAALLQAANRHLTGILEVPAAESGLHLIGRLKENICEKTLLDAARRKRIDLVPTSTFSVRKSARPSVILGYAPFNAKEMNRAAKTLAQAYTTSG